MTSGTIRYHIRVLPMDGEPSIGIAATALADPVGGVVRSTVPLHDGVHDLVLIDVPVDAAEYLEELLEADPTVVRYSTSNSEG